MMKYLLTIMDASKDVYRLTILNADGHVDEILETSLRTAMQRVLDLEQPKSKLVVRKDSRRKS